METQNIVKSSISREHFPDDFIFGAATSAYQIEGAAREDGRGPSIWDEFTSRQPTKVKGKANGDTAANSYYMYKDDILLMKKIGFDAYRFSISWCRILPGGKINRGTGVNQEGINYYNNLINELLANGIKPFVTLLHFDVPQALEEEYGGFLDRKIVKHFAEYAELCFQEFGDRVKHWITINEPFSFSSFGYATGDLAPGRGSTSMGHSAEASVIPNKCFAKKPNLCEAGDPGREPYIVTHHQLLAHARAVALYRMNYQPVQGGEIGISLVSPWIEPRKESNHCDCNAQRRALDFMLGWFMEPLTRGQYPASMRKLVGDRLPTFSREESDEVEGSFDFIGLNYYTTSYVKTRRNEAKILCYSVDGRYELISESRDGAIGPKGGSSWLHVHPEGIHKLLVYIKEKYKDPIIYITENGYDDIHKNVNTISKACFDNRRIKFYKDHLSFVKMAIAEGVKVRGYFMWSLLDNFEWGEGYTVRFGIIYVDFEDFTRIPKMSAIWFMSFLKEKRNNQLKNEDEEEGEEEEEEEE